MIEMVLFFSKHKGMRSVPVTSENWSPERFTFHTLKVEFIEVSVQYLCVGSKKNSSSST